MRLSKRGKRRLTVVALTALVLAAAAGGFRLIRQAQQQRMTAEARQTGLDAYRRGDLDLALTKLKYYFDQHADDLEVNLVYAEACARKPQRGARHLFDAVDHYAAHVLPLLDDQPRTAEVTRQRRDVLVRLLNLYAQIGDRERVEMAADELLKIEPSMIDALAARGEVQFLSRRFDEALATAQRLIELEPDNLTWRRMLLEVRARQGAGDDELVQQCREWAAQYQGDARFRLLAAATLMDAHQRDEARAELQSVAALGANSSDVLEQLVGLLDALDMRSEGDGVILATQERFPREAWVHEIAVRRLWHDGRIDEALPAIDRALEDVPEPTPALLRLRVVTLMAADRDDEAISALQPLLDMSAADQQWDADRAWASAIAATLRRDEALWRENVEALQAALTFAPKDPVLHFLMADASLRAGEFAGAIASFQQAVTLAPTWIAAGLAHGESLRSAGRLAEAFEVSQAVLSRAASDQPAPFMLFARCLIELREAGITPSLSGVADLTADTLATLRQFHAQAADEPAVVALLARGYLASGDVASLQGLARQTMASDQASADVLLHLAEITRNSDVKLQRELVARAREIADLTIPVALAEARLLAEADQADEGLQLIDRAMLESRLQDPIRRRAMLARAAYLIDFDESSAALAEMSALASEYAGSLEVQQFVLSQPIAWGDSTLIARAMANLKRLLGDASTQVRLAEANFLIRNHPNEPQMLARAITTLNAVLEEAPDSLAALSLAAEALTLGDHPSLDRASAHLERAALLYPGEPSLLVRLVALLQQQGRFDAARRHLQRLAEVLPNHPQFAFDELRLLHAQGDFETALVRAGALVNEQSPPPQQLLLAAMEERVGAIDRAEAIYTRLLSASPGDTSITAQAAEFYAATGRFARGLALLEEMPEASGGPSRAVLIGGFQQRHGRREEAGRWLRQAVKQHPELVQARDELARHYLSLGDRARARDEAMQGLKIDREHRGLRSTLAIANLDLPNADRVEAIKLLREFGSGNDALLAMLELLEQTPVRDGRSAPTAANLARARQLTDQHPMFLPAWQLAISLHMEAGRSAEAAAIARSAVSRLPGEAQPSEWATQLLMNAGRWDEALVEAEEWRRRTLADPLAADCALAGVHIVLRRPADALERVQSHAQRIIEEREAFPLRLATLIEALVRSDETARARQIMAPLLAEHRRWREMWTTVAGLMPSAEAETALIEIEPLAAEPEEWLALAMQWLALAQRTNQPQHLERAEALAQRAADQATTAVGAAMTLGAVAEARSDLALAEQHYRTALDKAPENAIALNNLAYVIALQPSRAAEALPLIERALGIYKDQPDFLDTYGLALLAAGRAADAEEAFRRALDLRPDEPSFMLSLAAAHLEQNQTDHAAVLLDQVERRSTLNAAQRQRLHDLKERLGAAENTPSTAAQPTSSSN